MEKKKESLAYPLVFMTLITGIFIFVLALLNHITLPIIEENQSLELKKKILYVFDLYEEDMSNEDVVQAFSHIELDSFDGKDLYVYKGEDKTYYGLAFEGPGLWGNIQGYLGIDEDFSQLTGIEFISQSETPGLGGRIGEDFYKEQFRNLPIDSKSDSPLVNRPGPGGNVDAITGATQTSQFVIDMINKDLSKFIKGGK